jgi:hypothetical protein
VNIRLIEGRSQQRKDEISKRVTDAISEVLQLPKERRLGCFLRYPGRAFSNQMPVTLTSLSLTSTDLPHFGVGADPDAALLGGCDTPGVGGDISSILNKIVVEWAVFPE